MKKYRIDATKGMEFGLYSLGDHILNPLTGSRISARATNSGTCRGKSIS